MPIRPERRSLYPANWKAISLAIREREQWQCGGSPGFYPECRAANGQPHPVTGSKVVLTVAHLDHDESSDDPANLRAMCQRCHLAYDRENKLRGMRDRRSKDQSMSNDIHADIAALAGQDIEVVYIDPPWQFKSNSVANPGRNAMRHYPTMPIKDIEAIPIKPILAKNAMVAMWTTPAFLVSGVHLRLFKAWGVTPSSILFTWVKLRKNHVWHHKIGMQDLAFPTGLTTRKQTEQIILGVRGNSLRVDGGLPEIIFAPVRGHSQKPDEAAARILRYVGPGRRMIEAFSRSTTPGFEPYGNEVGKFDVKEAAE